MQDLMQVVHYGRFVARVVVIGVGRGLGLENVTTFLVLTKTDFGHHYL